MKKYVPVIAILIIPLTLVLAIWFDDLVDRVIVQPVTYLIFMAQIVLGSFHQGVVWVSFIVITLLIALMILIPELSPPSQPEDEEWDYPDRIHIWERHIRAMEEGDYLRISLEDHVADLVVDALSYREGARKDTIIKQFRNGEMKFPLEVHQLMMAGYQPSMLDEKVKYQYRPEEIIQFLESQIDGSS